MAEPIVIEFAGDPIPKGRPRFASTGEGRPVAYTPAKTRKYASALRYAAQVAMDGQPLLIGPITVSVTAYLPLLKSFSQKQRTAAIRGELLPDKRPDTDNYLKQALDSLEGVVYVNDSQACFITASKLYAERPRLRIEVSSLNSTEGQ